MAQRIAVKKHQSAGRDFYRARHDRGALFAGMQLIVQPAGRLVDDAEQQCVATAGVIRVVVVPSDMVARAGIEIERIGMRIVIRRDLQLSARHRPKPWIRRGEGYWPGMDGANRMIGWGPTLPPCLCPGK